MFKDWKLKPHPGLQGERGEQRQQYLSNVTSDTCKQGDSQRCCQVKKWVACVTVAATSYMVSGNRALKYDMTWRVVTLIMHSVGCGRCL